MKGKNGTFDAENKEKSPISKFICCHSARSSLRSFIYMRHAPIYANVKQLANHK